MANITIIIRGDKEAIGSLKRLSEGITEMDIPLAESSSNYMNAISSNFSDEGKTFGQPWPPLSEATIAIKRALKAQGKAIEVEKPLVRTGAMREGFGYDLIGKNISRIYNQMSYALVHQEGGTVKTKGKTSRVPKRVLAEVDDKRVSMVANIFEKWVRNIISQARLDV